MPKETTGTTESPEAPETSEMMRFAEALGESFHDSVISALHNFFTPPTGAPPIDTVVIGSQPMPIGPLNLIVMQRTGFDVVLHVKPVFNFFLNDTLSEEENQKILPELDALLSRQGQEVQTLLKSHLGDNLMTAEEHNILLRKVNTATNAALGLGDEETTD